jgi:hypothetical protein
LSLNTAAMSSSTISGSLLSVRMGTGPMFAQAMIAVNRRLKAECRSDIIRGLLWAVSSLSEFFDSP